MRVLHQEWDRWELDVEPSAVTIGVLDGVHRGHQRLLAELSAEMTRLVLTFEPHPIEVLRPGSDPRLITTIDERLDRFAQFNIDVVGVLDLSAIKELEPSTFVKELLVDRLRIAQLVVGPDFRFGKDRRGDIALLRQLGRECGFVVKTLDLVSDSGGALSSSRVRGLIESGEIEEATEILGSRFELTGPVIGGDRRGREIGFPTANMQPPDRKVLPAIGVYAAFARIGSTVHEAAVNVGVRPTFGGGELLVEAFLLDFDQDIYGEQLTIEFVSYIRPELTFEEVKDLTSRMQMDVEECRRILSAADSNMV